MSLDHAQRLSNLAEVIGRMRDHRQRAADAAYDTLRSAEAVAAKAYDAARDAAAAAAERAFHEYIVGVRTQVEAQYGPDSDQLQSLGIKKK